ncbi:MAG: hypothetical protein Q8K38_08180 [Burkholderiaceae bacterium]|jgi:hypothetical protein|uniref:hypothetical protein n=1 Tax=Hydrogenophaga sp. TaxID=1904254 RepID=UPI000CAF6D8C|nr:hypothetical protein [Hydrogenophaga sp.]MDP2065929.1 hypothetical protein [Burkholderiaceae bacterium]MDZ4144038.1 hypothetical protein [Burkholderiales bacterium]MDZ4398863.1 hypothetical protein [Hydrogenophaga sp.]PKO45293.1 MAG: hypothetical protein CVU30_00130 [Betaproteobacteria bacterium HGW-Betaproteobacteria-3]
MGNHDYLIESNHPVSSRFFSRADVRGTYPDWHQAVAIAAKSTPSTFGDEIRVVHVPSGEIVFRLTPQAAPASRGGWRDFDPD